MKYVQFFAKAQPLFVALVLVLTTSTLTFAQDDGTPTQEPTKVFVLDSGVNENEFVDADGNQLPIAGTYNAAEPNTVVDNNDSPELVPNTDVSDSDGHGTAMLNTYGQVAGEQIASGDLEIYVVKVSNSDGTITSEDMEAALAYAEENGADVISMSIGSEYITAEQSATLNRLNDSGVIVVAAAGNENNDSEASTYTLPAGVIGVGSLDYENNNESISSYSSGVLSPNVDVYATEGTQDLLQGTSAATAYTGATLAKSLATNEIPASFDTNGDGRFDTNEVEQYMSSPHMADRTDFIATETATYQTLSTMGFEYDADNDMFVSKTGDQYSPLYLGVDDNPETIEQYMQYYTDNPVSPDRAKMTTLIGTAPLISRELELTGDLSAELLSSEPGATQFQAYKEMGMLDAGYEYDEGEQSWVHPETGDSIPFSEVSSMGFSDFTGTMREAQLTELGLTQTDEGWVDADGTLVLSGSIDIASIPEEEYISAVYDATGIIQPTYLSPYSLSPEEQATYMTTAGYVYDADTGMWQPDVSTLEGVRLYSSGIRGISEADLSSMSAVEFQTLLSEAHLAQTGYSDNGDGTWTNNVTGETVAIDSNTGLPVVQPGDDGGGTGGGGTGGGGTGGGTGDMDMDMDSAIVPCGFGDGASFSECTFCDLIKLVENLLDFAMFFAVIVATLLFVYSGVLYVFSPTNPGNISKAHSIFISTLIGICIVLASWLIVDLLMSQFASEAFENWNFSDCSTL